MRSVPTILVEKNTLFREGLSKLLAGTAFRVTATVSSPEELRPGLSSELRPMLIILGLTDDDQSSEHNIRALRTRFPDARLVVLADQYNAGQILAAFRQSANGYLTKTVSWEALIKSLELVMLGESIIPSAILMQMRDDQELDSETYDEPSVQEVPGPHSTRVLSARETQILHCLVSGQSNKMIARNFDIMEATVKVHIKAILRKIHVQNRTQAAIWAVEHMERTGARAEIESPSHKMARMLMPPSELLPAAGIESPASS